MSKIEDASLSAMKRAEEAFLKEINDRTLDPNPRFLIPLSSHLFSSNAIRKMVWTKVCKSLAELTGCHSINDNLVRLNAQQPDHSDNKIELVYSASVHFANREQRPGI